MFVLLPYSFCHDSCSSVAATYRTVHPVTCRPVQRPKMNILFVHLTCSDSIHSLPTIISLQSYKICTCSPCLDRSHGTIQIGCKSDSSMTNFGQLGRGLIVSSPNMHRPKANQRSNMSPISAGPFHPSRCLVASFFFNLDIISVIFSSPLPFNRSVRLIPCFTFICRLY